MRLKDKIALVTGSATGIGEAIARRFAQEGARVMVHDRPEKRADGEKVAADIVASGGEAAFTAADIADPAACEELIAAVVQRFGTIQILVNNAAVMTRSNLETSSPEVFDRTISINMRAPMLLIRAALPHFRRNGGGAVLNIGSINAYCGESNPLAYSMAKGGLMTMTRNLADALGRDKIRVNQLNPGWVVTPNERALKIREGLPPDWPDKVAPAFAPFGRLHKPEEVAYWALNFVSDENALVSGAVCDIEQYPLIGRNPIK
jgi:NAD(P)-dependent dehydrogenase (short-subunit alcohol dehydrogenase family)